VIGVVQIVFFGVRIESLLIWFLGVCGRYFGRKRFTGAGGSVDIESWIVG
jgi:hypothetical protein